MEERNPSPPREFEDEAETFRQDMVGETAISKRWVYSILMTMCKEIQKQTETDEDTADIANDLQDEMCQLWDLSVEADVACFLADSDYIPLLCGIIERSKSPRLTEITVGILGNMACSSVVCAKISEYDKVFSVISSLLSCRDSPTLNEVGRLIKTCLTDKFSKGIWLDFFEIALPELLEDIKFILSSSSNSVVLRNMLEFIDVCMDSRDSLMNYCVEMDFVNSVTEAGLQLIKDDDGFVGLISCLHILYLLTTIAEKAASLFESNSRIFNIAIHCCEVWIKLDDFNIIEDNPSPIPVASCFSILEFLIDVSSTSEDFSKTVTKSQKETLCMLSKLVLEHCEKDLKSDAEKVACASEEKNSECNGSSVDCSADEDRQIKNKKTGGSMSEVYHGVPLLEITRDLTNILVRNKWKA